MFSSLYLIYFCLICCLVLPNTVAAGLLEWVPGSQHGWLHGLVTQGWHWPLVGSWLCGPGGSLDWGQPADGRGWVLTQLAARPLVGGISLKVQILWNAFLNHPSRMQWTLCSHSPLHMLSSQQIACSALCGACFSSDLVDQELLQISITSM